jgi:hypothetical protein
MVDLHASRRPPLPSAAGLGFLKGFVSWSLEKGGPDEEVRGMQKFAISH